MSTDLTRRGVVVGAAASPTLAAAMDMSTSRPQRFDLIVMGAGSTGLPAAITAAAGGASVLVLEHSPQLGGSLHVANGQMSAAGTRHQRQKGVEDSPEDHFADVMRLSRGTVDETLVRLAIWNAAATIDWLCDLGFEPDPASPTKGIGHEPYSKARYLWGMDKGHSIRRVLEAELQRQVDAGRVTIALEHEVVDLITAGGAVTGVVALGPDGARRRYEAPAVLLASGGYNANPKMFKEICGRDLYTTLPYPYGRGAGHRLAMSVGGYLRGVENFFINFGYTLAETKLPSPLAGRAITYPERRAPWEIYVNTLGERFVREDMPSIDARENALIAQPGERYWIVFDQAILDRAPPLYVGWSREQVAAAFASGRPNFHKADTLEGLAKATGLDAARLATTVAGYNYGVATGSDFFGRQHLPQAISMGPFYAVRQQGAPVSSAAGVAVNGDLQVIRRDGSPIRGLYAAGEILGSGQLMGRATCGGMMVTPALTFGRLLGERFAAASRASA